MGRVIIIIIIIIPNKKDNEMPSLEQGNDADMECGDSETVQMAQVSCCMTMQKVLIISPHYPLCVAHSEGVYLCLMLNADCIQMEMEENEMPSIEGDDEVCFRDLMSNRQIHFHSISLCPYSLCSVPSTTTTPSPYYQLQIVVMVKRMEDMVETHDEAAEMCKAEGTGWGLCLMDDLMSGQIYVQETVEEEPMTIAAAVGATESYGVWVHDQCEPFSMEVADDIIDYEAVGMTEEFNATNESNSDTVLIGAGIGAVVILLVVGLFAMIMKWRKTTAKGQESKVQDEVLRMEDGSAPNVVPVEDDDDSSEVANADGTANVDAVTAAV